MQKKDHQNALTIINELINISPEFQGFDYLKAMTENIWKVFAFKHIVIGQIHQPTHHKVSSLIALDNGEIVDSYNYQLAGTPCENVVSTERVCFYSDNVDQQFPEDTMLVDMGIKSYIGAPIFFHQKPIGLIAFLDDKKVDISEHYTSLIEFLSARLALEFERYIQSKQIIELKQKANHDDLTGLLRRNAFFDNLALLKPNIHGCCLVIDIDNFKAINDTLGHDKGDCALVAAAECIQKCVPQGQNLARMGGEEFVLFLAEYSLEQADKIALDIHQCLQYATCDTIPLTVSIGIAEKTAELDFKETIQLADQALYKAKQQGKNRTNAA